MSTASSAAADTSHWPPPFLLYLGNARDDLAAKTAQLKAQSVKFTTEPTPLKLASGVTVNFAYLEGPAGARVELVQR